MYTLAAGEKATLVMIYTVNTLIRGEVVTAESIRVNTWLRTTAVPEFMHILKPQVLLFGSGSVKTFSYSEMFLPTAMIIGFHPVLPADNILDYAEDEKNRQMVPVTAGLGTFLLKGKLRISALTGMASSIEMAHTNWTSIYEVEITNPYLPQMPPLRIAMVLLSTKNVGLAVEGA